jgi:hypothetical protein
MCKCGCNTCETKGPLLTEGKVKSLLSEGLQYHIDKKIPLFETVYRIGSDKHLALIKEARKMYSRNVIDLCEDDKVLIGTNLGEFALYEGESVPLDLPMLDESDSNYPDFELNKNIRYQEGSISSGMWRYTGQEQGGKGVYRNLNNDQILAFDRNDFDIFRKHLSSHFDFSESINESKMPTQDQVDKFFALTNNEMHYLNSKPVAGQEKTFNKMEVEPWDEYDLSNFNSLVRKAKSKGKINENKAIITFKNDYEVKMNHIAGYDDDFEHFEAGERESVYILDKNAPSQRVHVEFGDGTNAFIPKDVISFQEKSLNEVEKDINQLKNLSNRKERYNYIKNFSKEKLIDIADELYLDYEEYDDIEDKVLNSFGESLNEGEYRIEYEDEDDNRHYIKIKASSEEEAEQKSSGLDGFRTLKSIELVNEATRKDLGMVTSVSKRRAKAELKNPGNDGFKVSGLDKDGKRVYIKSIKDIDKFFDFELVNEAKDKVDVASLSIGNTYKDNKGYPVKVIDIKGTGNRWKVTYQHEDGKKKTVSTSLDKGINLYESVNESNKISDDKLMKLIPKLPKGYVGKNTGVGVYYILTPDGGDIVLTQSKDKKNWSYRPSILASKILAEAYSGFLRNPEDPDSEKFEPTGAVAEFREELRALFGKFKGDLKNPEFIKGVAQIMVNWKSLLRSQLDEAKKEKKDPPLNKPKRGGSKAYYVYVRDPKTKKIKKVSFGSGGLRAKIKNAKARKAFAARHNCKNKKDRTKAGYWSCNLPRYAEALGLGAKMNTFW